VKKDWNDGILEKWNIEEIGNHLFYPSFHHSIIP